MDTPVSAIMSKNVFTVRPDESLQSVNDAMNTLGFAAIAVTTTGNDTGSVVGIITRHDMKKCHYSEFKNKLASDVMSKNPLFLPSSTSIDEVESTMKRNRFRSILIGERRRLEGIVTSSDIARYRSGGLGAVRITKTGYAQKPTTVDVKGKSNHSFAAFVVLCIIGIALVFFLAPNSLFGLFGIKANDTNYSDSLLTPSQNGQNQNIEPVAPSPPPKIPKDVASIYFPQNILDYINSRFAQESTEFKLCLYGQSYSDGILITSYKEPKYTSRSSTLVVAEDCDYYSIGFIHSHPNGMCDMSGGDISNLMNQGKPVEGIVCGVNRISFYNTINTANTMKIYTVKLDSQNSVDEKTDITLSNTCPIGDFHCNGECYHGCTSQGQWSCTSSGGLCTCNPGITACSL